MILEYIDALPTEEERMARRKILAGFELAAARASIPNDGAEETIRMIRRRGIDIGILTRNTRASVMESLKNFRTVTESDFKVIVTRESAGRPKPHPDGVLDAARQLRVAPREMLVVGDFTFDIAAGRAAGSPTVLLTNGRTPPQTRIPGIASQDATPDFTIASLGQLAGILGL